MAHVFLSHSKKDHAFADLVQLKLKESGVDVWVDHERLGAGAEWRNGIDKAITDSFAILLALSDHSVKSSFVTYEWASAIGKGKPVIPLLLSECDRHPKIEMIQHLNFSSPGQLPWRILIERIREIEQEELQSYDDLSSTHPKNDNPIVVKIMKYMDQKGYQMISFDRVRKIIDKNWTNDDLDNLINGNSDIFRFATLRGNRRGLRKL